MLPLLHRLYGNGLATAFACPPDLLADIVRINVLRSDKSLEGVERLRTATAILQHILAFSPEGWAIGIISARHAHENHPKLMGGGNVSPDREVATCVRGTLADWTPVARIYQAAVAIYCIESSESSAGSYGAGDIIAGSDGLRKHVADELLRGLKAVAAGSTSLGSHLRKVVIWPLVVAGIEVAADDCASRRFIIQELKWIGVAAGTNAPVRGVRFLEGLWARKTPRGRWDDLFNEPYVFAV